MLRKLNLSLIITPVVLFSFGLITLLSTSGSLVRNHIVFFLIGIVFYVIAMNLDTAVYKFSWRFVYLLALVFLVLTYVFAESRSGSARWLSLGFVNFQTSEFAKLALIVFTAGFLDRVGASINNPLKLGLLLILLIPILGLIFVQPDLGTVLVLLVIFGSVLFFSELHVNYIISVILAGGIFSAPVWNLLKDYQKERIHVFLNPQLDVLGSGYNVIQSLIAVGSGGVFGKGFGRGTQANLQFLPAYWTDFIFASFAEEWGLIGVFLLILSFTVMLLSILYVAHLTGDTFSKYLVIGIFTMFFIQFVINVGMNIGIMPVTGVTLPLISYGGSSMVFSLFSLGIVQNIWIKR